MELASCYNDYRLLYYTYTNYNDLISNIFLQLKESLNAEKKRTLEHETCLIYFPRSVAKKIHSLQTGLFILIGLGILYHELFNTLLYPLIPSPLS